MYTQNLNRRDKISGGRKLIADAHYSTCIMQGCKHVQTRMSYKLQEHQCVIALHRTKEKQSNRNTVLSLTTILED